MQNTNSRFIAFFDECGDHSLEKIDNDFPIFVLSVVVFERDFYVKKLIPSISELKLKFWNHEGVNLHSRDIRKAYNDFCFMQNANKRKEFIDHLNSIVLSAEFTLFVTVIDKRKHIEKYKTKAASPYDLSLEFSFERILHFLEQNNENILPFIAESRGRKEDLELEVSFYKIISSGTYFHSASKFERLDSAINFRKKRDNIAGMQIADLCAYPTARKVLNPEKINQAFEIISSKFYNCNRVNGLKVFP